MSAADPNQDEMSPQLSAMLQNELLRKARAEADMAEALAQQQQAAVRQALKKLPDEAATPGVVPPAGNDDPAPAPPAKETPQKGTDAPATVEAEARPREGSVTLDEKAGYLTTVIAYRAMLALADKVAGRINSLELGEARILLVEALDFAAADTAVLQLSTQITAWQKELKRLNGRLEQLIAEAQKSPALDMHLPSIDRLAPAFIAGLAPAALLPLVTGAVSAAADLIGYFKTDYAISGRDVSASDQAIRARVAGGISGATVYWQDFYRIKASPLLAEFGKVVQAQAQVQQNLDLLKSTVIDPLAAQIALLGAEIERLQAALKQIKLPEQAAEKETLEREIKARSDELAAAARAKRAPDLVQAQTRAVLDVIDGNIAQLTAVPQGQQLSALGRAALRDYLDVLGITHLLHVAVVSSGGEVVTGKNWFLGAPQAGYLAGGVISYVLGDTNGAIIAADTLAGTDYVKFKLGQDVLS